MKLGLLTDIHEQVELLEAALERFEQEQVDQIVVMGDVVELAKRLEPTCQLLTQAGAIGVWGNHDYGLCVDPPPDIRAEQPPVVMDFMASLKPRLEIGDCHFTHVEPWLNPQKLTDLWYYDGPPDEHQNLKRIFNAVPNRLLFVGHFHKWLHATPKGISDWQGKERLMLDRGRHFVVVGALCHGQFAILDTHSHILVPFDIANQAPPLPDRAGD